MAGIVTVTADWACADVVVAVLELAGWGAAAGVGAGRGGAAVLWEGLPQAGRRR